MELKGYGAYIREARERRGITQEELAEALGVTGSQVSRFENEAEDQAPAVKHIMILVEELDISAEVLLQKMGVEISSRGERRLPTRLRRILLEMSDQALDGLLAVLEGARNRAETDQTG